MIRGLLEKLGLGSDEAVTAATADLRSPKTQMAMALGRTKTEAQIYAGTVPHADVQRRRARNRVARQSRRINRGQR